ncbi:MAG: ATP-binding cassette domain-containing protein [Candidatus Izemoplasmatales bacterium]
MLRIEKVNKTYNQGKSRKEALSNISLELNHTGMVFILGKSGSGKSTLLNIIGGLDSFDNGEITYFDRSLAKMTDRELDQYRNYEIGMVFQEFNLLERFNVYDNLSFCLELQHTHLNQDQFINDALARVNLDGFSSRDVRELSGGEKQRVAIARAILKNPKIILADEPTGNLDSENGQMILSILKEISKTKLVIVVTHDLENALAFADRIISISDGVITKDEKRSSNDTSDYLKIGNIHEMIQKREHISFKYILNLALTNLKSKKGRIIITIFSFVLSLFLINMGLTYIFFNYEKSSINTFETAELREYPLFKTDSSLEDVYYRSYQDNEISSLINEYPDISFYKNYYRPVYGFFTLDYVYSFSPYQTDCDADLLTSSNVIILNSNAAPATLIDGQYPIETGDIAITDYTAEMLVKYHVFQGVEDIHDLLGKTITKNNELMQITGILGTNYLDEYSSSKDLQELIDSGYMVLLNSIYTSIYMTQDTFDSIFNTTGYMINTVNDHQYNIGIGSPEYSIDEYTLVGDMPIKENEVVVSLSMLSNYIGNEVVPGDITGDAVRISNYIGETISINESYYGLGEEEYIITGIIDDFNMSNRVQLVFNKSMYEFLVYQNMTSGIQVALFAQMNQDNVSYDEIVRLTEDRNAEHYTVYSIQLYGLKDVMTKTGGLVSGIGAVLIIISGFLIYSYISQSIYTKQKEIGIMRALGATKNEVSKIYLLESFIVVLISYLLSIILVYIAVQLQNNSITHSWNLSIRLLYIDYKTILTGCGIAILASLLSAYIPIRKMILLTPITAIRKI